MPPNVNKYLVVIAGPTAAGKSGISLMLAKHFHSVIVSADSRQIYRQMDIGTAKPSPAELARVKHYFIDHVSPGEDYSAGRFQSECLALLERLFAQHDLVILVGGSGLYIKAVLEGFDDLPPVPISVRRKWEDAYNEKGIEFLRDELSRRDPAYAEVVDQDNPRRLVRALSIIEVSGKTFTELRRQKGHVLPYGILKILCTWPRNELYARIDHRVDEMMASGLVAEVEALLKYRETQAMHTVGYQEILKYLDGTWSLDTAVGKIKQHTRNYAKRQLTWFRNQDSWEEFCPPEPAEIISYIEKKIRS